LLNSRHVGTKELNPQKALKALSDVLQRFPWLWRIGILVYGFKKFNPEKVNYKKRSIDLPLFEGSSKKYNLIFDAQCLQTLTRQRGIGNYSLSLIGGVCRARPEEHFAAYLTPVVSESDLKAAISLLQSLGCTNLDILIFDIFGSKSKVSLHDAESNLTKVLSSTKSKMLMIMSSFEKPKSVIFVPKDLQMTKFGILYDLIPLQFETDLLISGKQKSAYKWLLSRVSTYDQLLAISHETKSSWRHNIGSNPIIDVIYGGGSQSSGKLNKTFQERNGFLCVGAEQPHKNIDRLIAAYCLLPDEIQRKHELTVVGIRSAGARKRLQGLPSRASGNVNLPTYLDASSLDYLYEKSRLLVMPSLAEGLSLPILEAWSHGLVAIGSANTVAQELITDHTLLFDPHSPEAISQKMLELATNESLWNNGLTEAIASAEKFTWSQTAARALTVIEENLHD
jgi:hypothetical protein